jgi:hypothetical protein
MTCCTQRHKIEAQNEKVSAVRKRYNAAKQVMDPALRLKYKLLNTEAVLILGL